MFALATGPALATASTGSLLRMYACPLAHSHIHAGMHACTCMYTHMRMHTLLTHTDTHTHASMCAPASIHTPTVSAGTWCTSPQSSQRAQRRSSSPTSPPSTVSASGKVVCRVGGRLDSSWTLLHNVCFPQVPCCSSQPKLQYTLSHLLLRQTMHCDGKRLSRSSVKH